MARLAAIWSSYNWLMILRSDVLKRSKEYAWWPSRSFSLVSPVLYLLYKEYGEVVGGAHLQHAQPTKTILMEKIADMITMAFRWSGGYFKPVGNLVRLIRKKQAAIHDPQCVLFTVMIDPRYAYLQAEWSKATKSHGSRRTEHLQPAIICNFSSCA